LFNNLCETFWMESLSEVELKQQLNKAEKKLLSVQHEMLNSLSELKIRLKDSKLTVEEKQKTFDFLQTLKSDLKQVGCFN